MFEHSGMAFIELLLFLSFLVRFGRTNMSTFLDSWKKVTLDDFSALA